MYECVCVCVCAYGGVLGAGEYLLCGLVSIFSACACADIYMHVNIYASIRVCVCVCIYIYIYTYKEVLSLHLGWNLGLQVLQVLQVLQAWAQTGTRWPAARKGMR